MWKKMNKNENKKKYTRNSWETKPVPINRNKFVTFPGCRRGLFFSLMNVIRMYARKYADEELFLNPKNYSVSRKFMKNISKIW